MNYLSDKPKLIEHWVVYCKGFNVKEVRYEFLRVEKSMLTYHERPLIEAYNFKRHYTLYLSLHIRDWITNEPLPMFLIPPNEIALCFDRQYIKVYQFIQNSLLKKLDR